MFIEEEMFTVDGESSMTKADVSGLDVSLPNIFLLIAFNPTGYSTKEKFQIQTPGYESSNNKDDIKINDILKKCSENKHTLYQQLLVGYRCAKPIADLSNYCKEHDVYIGDSDANHQLDFSNDQKADEENLPTSPKGLERPIVVLRTKDNKKNVTLNQLVDYITKNYAKDFSTTVIYHAKEDLEVEGSDKKKKIVSYREIQGIEDEFIIYSVSSSSNNTKLNDALTRARNGLVLVIDTDSK